MQFPHFIQAQLIINSMAVVLADLFFEIDGKTIYHAGDTALTSEMKTIRELYQPDIVMLPIGGHYTMDIEHVVKSL